MGIALRRSVRRAIAADGEVDHEPDVLARQRLPMQPLGAHSHVCCSKVLMVRLALAIVRSSAFLALSLIVSLVTVSRAQMGARDTSGTVVGLVYTDGGNVPLPYSVVSVSAIGEERFTDAHGVFSLTGLPSGPVRVRVRHLGYSPAELPVLVRAGGVDTIRVSLEHLTVHLPPVDVNAYGPCTAPGAPSAAVDSGFATAFEQLRQNAEQYRLLTERYPFVYAVERKLSHKLVNGRAVPDGIDTLVITSPRWTYAPGELISRSGRGRSAVVSMYLPTLANFAEQSFLDNHCFYYGGLERVAGSDLLRIDFTAAASIKDPDVDGSMYLDPESFQIRRSILHLTKIPPEIAGVTSTEAVTVFGEILPFIPVIASVSSIDRFNASKALPLANASASEQQRLIGLRFVKGMPGEDASGIPPGDAASRSRGVPRVP